MIFFDSRDLESENEERANTKITRRYFIDKSNPPLEICENDFVQQLWASNKCFLMIFNSLCFPTNIRSTSVPPVFQLCATLILLASGSYESNVDTNVLISMAQTTISKLFRRTLSLLENTAKVVNSFFALPLA